MCITLKLFLLISTIPFVFTDYMKLTKYYVKQSKQTTYQKLVHFLFLSEAHSGGVMGRRADS
jgi:hypothetical protein